MPDHKREKGFTLIELVATLLIVAIVSVVVISRGTSTADVNLKASAEAVKSHIRYAQMRAMNMTSSDTICAASFGMFMSGGSYYMFRDCNTGNKVPLPGADGSDVTLPGGMTVSGGTFSFDVWGMPYPVVNPASTINPSSTINLTISYQGQTEPVIITQNTGYVP